PNVSRVVHRFEKGGTFRITASPMDTGRVGDFTLTVDEAAPLDLLQLQSEQMFKLTGAEKVKLAQALAANLEAQQGEAGVREMNLARRVAQNMDQGPQGQKLAREVHLVLGKALAKAKAADVARAGRQLLGVGKRLGLVGEEMAGIRGMTVDGKEFDLAK